MATIEYQRYRDLCTPPEGERRLTEEWLGFKGTEQVNLMIETCGDRLRFFITSGVYLEQTFQMRVDPSAANVKKMRDVAMAWVRNTPRFSKLTTHATFEQIEVVEGVAS